MGLKDLLFGKKEDANKVTYREEVKKAVATGDLTPEKIAELERRRSELDVTSLSQEMTQVRRDVYNKAADAVKGGGQLSAEDEAKLAKIQAFLGLKDAQIAQTKNELGRMKMMTEMKVGKFPTVSEHNIVLRGMRFNPGETPRWSEIAIMLEAADTAGVAGLKLVAGMSYQVGAATPYSLSLKGAAPISEGNLLMTSERLIFKGAEKVVATPVDKPEEISLYKDGIRLKMSNGKALLFKFRSVENADFFGLMICNALNPNAASAGSDEDLDFLN